MLEDALFESGNRRKGRSPLSLVLSTMAHAVIVAAGLLIPLAHTEVIPVITASALLAPPRPELPPAPEVPRPPVQLETATIVDPAAFVAPTEVPPEIASVVDNPVVDMIRVPVGGATSDTSSIMESILESRPEGIVSPPAPPPPPAVPEPTRVEPYRVGGNVQQANLIHRVSPTYPPLARRARVFGVVVLEATINKEGEITNVRVVSGHPLLNPAAEEAVQQWRYKPTRLNGEPVEVITTITVSFTLQ